MPSVHVIMTQHITTTTPSRNTPPPGPTRPEPPDPSSRSYQNGSHGHPPAAPFPTTLPRVSQTERTVSRAASRASHRDKPYERPPSRAEEEDTTPRGRNEERGNHTNRTASAPAYASPRGSPTPFRSLADDGVYSERDFQETHDQLMEDNGDDTIRYPITQTGLSDDTALDIIGHLDAVCNTFVNAVNAACARGQDPQIKQYVLKIVQFALSPATSPQQAPPLPMHPCPPPPGAAVRPRPRGSRPLPTPPTAYKDRPSRTSALAAARARINHPQTRVDGAVFPETRPPHATKSSKPAKNPKDIIRQVERIQKALPNIPAGAALQAAKATPTAKTSYAQKAKAQKPKVTNKGDKPNTVVIKISGDHTLCFGNGFKLAEPDLARIFTEEARSIAGQETLTLSNPFVAARWAGNDRIIVQLKQTCTAEEAAFWKRVVLGAANVEQEEGEIVNRCTHSTLKFTGVPTQIRGSDTIDLVMDILHAHPKWREVRLLERPIFIKSDSVVSTLLVKVVDDNTGRIARSLLSTSINFWGIVKRCEPWINHNSARMCTSCLRWGHSAHFCRSHVSYCAQCAGPHHSVLHKRSCEECDDEYGSSCEAKCINCMGAHSAYDKQCPFYKARNNSKALNELLQQQKARNQAARISKGTRSMYSQATRGKGKSPGVDDDGFQMVL